MTAEFLVFLGIGKLIIYIGQLFVHNNTKNEFINKLFACDFCLGVWVYTILALLFKITILSDVIPYIPIVTPLIVGCFASYLIHLVSIGVREKYSVIVI